MAGYADSSRKEAAMQSTAIRPRRRTAHIGGTVAQLNEQLGIRLQPPERRKGRRRSDTLPEYTPYQDDGCDIHDHCLTCPLPRCRYEEPGGLRGLLNELRDQQMLQMRRKGATVDELANRFGVSRRTVFRVLGGGETARHRGEDGETVVVPASVARGAARQFGRADQPGERPESPFDASPESGLRTQRCA